MRPEGFEPPTLGSEDRSSSPLSYERKPAFSDEGIDVGSGQGRVPGYPDEEGGLEENRASIPKKGQKLK